MNSQEPKLLRPPAAGKRVNLSESTLAKMRMRGDGPPYSKVGAKIVVYNTTDLDAWVASRRRRSTSDQGGADLGEAA